MPTPPNLPAVLGLLDLLGIAVFAISGAALAARLGQSFVTLAFFALVTGVGGGTVRDLLIGAPVFWVGDPWVAPVCLAVALLVWFTPHRWWEGKLVEWADAVGLGAYATFGTAKALGYGVPPVSAMLMGVITGCVGGIIRDVLANRPSNLMSPEIYVSAAGLAAMICAGAHVLELPAWLGWTVAALAGFALRGAALTWGLALPAYQIRR